MAKRKKEAEASEQAEAKEHKKNWRETRASAEDIQNFLCDNILLRHNVISGEAEFRVPMKDEFDVLGWIYPTGANPLDEWRSAVKWQNVNDRLVNSLWNMLSMQKDVSDREIWRVIRSDFVPLYNPFTNYLSRLPPWDEETNPILELAMTVNVKGEQGEFVSSTDLLQSVAGNLINVLSSNKLGRAMTALGFEAMRSHGQRGYRVVAYTAEEIKANRSVLAYDAEPDSTVDIGDIFDTNDTLF